MNLEDNLQHSFFNQQESFHHCCNFKNELNDRTTHQFSSNDQLNRPNQQFLSQSPFRPSSFFFTPTSPRHFDIGNQSTAKSDFRLVVPKSSIDKRMTFEELEQRQNSENDDQILEQKGAETRKTPNRSIKNAKGLRNLSESVYMIVSEMSKTKYKLVAQRLISDIIKNGEHFDKEKDQHNVKRRVYDALNVLIAAGMLQKQGKEVVCNEPYQRGRKNMSKYKNSRQMIEKQKIQMQIKKKYDSIEQKRNMLQKLKQKKNNISKIIYRNKNEFSLHKNVLNFPLITTCIEEDKIKIFRNYQQEALFLFSYRPHLFGDVDLMLRITQQNNVKLQAQPENIYSVIQKEEDIEGQPRKEVKTEDCFECNYKIES